MHDALDKLFYSESSWSKNVMHRGDDIEKWKSVHAYK